MGDVNNSLGVSNNKKIDLDSYIESWKGEAACMRALEAMDINSNTVINIGFDSFDFSNGDPLPGLQFSPTAAGNAKALKEIINYIHSRGGKVQLSFGGVSYTIAQGLAKDSPEDLASKIANTIKTYGLDGVDLDIESGKIDPTKVQEFIKDLRAKLPEGKYGISLTVPGQYWAAESWIAGSAKYVDSVNFMEYDIWVDPKLQGTKEEQFVQQIKNDIKTYIDQWGIDPSKIHLGLMPGPDDRGAKGPGILGVTGAEDLTRWAKAQGLGGMMIWDANRDYEGAGGQSSMRYTNSIEKILWGDRTDLPQPISQPVRPSRRTKLPNPLKILGKVFA